MTEPLRILHAEDNPDDAELVRRHLKRAFDVTTVCVDREIDMRAAMESESFDLVLSDFRMPGFSVEKVVEIVHETDFDLPVLVVSGTVSEDEAVKLMTSGVRDYVFKDSLERLMPAIRRELRDAETRKRLIQQELETAIHSERATMADKLEAKNEQLSRKNLQLKEAQSQLIQSAKMASLGVLVAGIAHEVNNPLAYAMSHLGTIARNVKYVRERVPNDDNLKFASKLDRAIDRLSDSQEGLERVRDLVERLRTFARIDGGDMAVADIRESVETAVKLLGHRTKNGLSIRTAFADDNFIYCSAGAINQVLINLIANAIDAVDGKGEINIESRRNDEHFTIVVSDDGPGVPDTIRDRIFEPFFTTKDVGKGTGLGLSIVYRLIQNHGGSIEVHNRAGGGTKFVLSIPTQLTEAAS